MTKKKNFRLNNNNLVRDQPSPHLITHIYTRPI